MRWKEFFRINKKKILIVIIFFIFYNIFGYVWHNSLQCEMYTNLKDVFVPIGIKFGCSIDKSLLVIFGLPLFILEQLIPLESIDINPLIGFSLTTIVWLPYLYLISCAVVFFYNKLKPRKKKK